LPGLARARPRRRLDAIHRRRHDQLRPGPGADGTMRRLGFIAALVACAAAFVATSAGADDTRTYRIEMFNAFGIVDGSEVRISGVPAGTVTALDITEDKRAVATVELSGPLSELGADSECSSEPQ